ncbi:MAG: rod shape-determining protein MreC [Gammaproteobacteria bacterium]|nr:MAG: rod shape-determining protein MreC [Gammaproteobacteria bacterium]
MTKKPRASSQSQTALIALTILLLVCSVVTMVFDYRGKIPAIREVIQQNLSIPFKTAASWPQELQTGVSQYFASQKKLLAENAKLKKDIRWLKANLANQTVLEAEYRRLKNLFESTATHSRPVMIAEVLDSQIDANKHQIEINKGTANEVFPGQIVIDENGVVGQVTQLTEKTATVSMITDERQRIPVFVERNRLRMFARGTGNLNELDIDFVAKGSDIRVGDKVVTSGLGERYPRGYGIAVITEVQSSPIDEFMQIKAKPLALLDRVLEVLLINSQQITEEASNDHQ